MNVRRLLAYWIGAAAAAYVVVVLPIVVVMAAVGMPQPASGLIAFVVGMLAGGLTPPLFLTHPRVERWIDR